jgi:hypothetical protein
MKGKAELLKFALPVRALRHLDPLHQEPPPWKEDEPPNPPRTVREDENDEIACGDVAPGLILYAPCVGLVSIGVSEPLGKYHGLPP